MLGSEQHNSNASFGLFTADRKGARGILFRASFVTRFLMAPAIVLSATQLEAATLSLDISGRQYQGAPILEMKHGNKTIVGNKAVTNDFGRGQWQSVKYTVPDTGNITLYLKNDKAGKDGDRNLYFKNVKINGQAVSKNALKFSHCASDNPLQGGAYMICHGKVSFNYRANGQSVAQPAPQPPRQPAAPRPTAPAKQPVNNPGNNAGGNGDVMLRFEAASLNFEGPAKMRVKVGNKTLADAITVNAESKDSTWQSYSAAVPRRGTISITLTNDLYKKGKGDRNLYVKNIRVGGKPVSNNAVRFSACKDMNPQPNNSLLVCHGTMQFAYQATGQQIAAPAPTPAVPSRPDPVPVEKKPAPVTPPIAQPKPLPAPAPAPKPLPPVNNAGAKQAIYKSHLVPAKKLNINCNCNGLPNRVQDVAIAAERFGFGLGANDFNTISKFKGGPRCWALTQLCQANAETYTRGLPNGVDIHNAILRGNSRVGNTDLKSLYNKEIKARTVAAVKSKTPFVERLVHFFSNHFTVAGGSGSKQHPLIGAYEREVVRRHIQGDFYSMLKASSMHPAMMYYLDNNNNIGPNSPFSKRNPANEIDKANENYGREILEMYSVGLAEEFEEGDVIESAKIMTGWHPTTKPGETAFVFNVDMHEPGPKRVMGITFQNDENPYAEIDGYIKTLAAHPATATFIATKLAKHFSADTPPASLVSKLETAYKQSGGSIMALGKALVLADEVWNTRNQKYTTTNDFVNATFRAIDSIKSIDKFSDSYVAQSFKLLGQQVLNPEFPNGYSDSKGVWLSAGKLGERISWTRSSLNGVNERQVEFLVQNLLGEPISLRDLDDISNTAPPACRDLDKKYNLKSATGCTLRAIMASDDFVDRVAIILNSPEKSKR